MRILLIDDESAVRASLAHYLTPRGFGVSHADTCAAAASALLDGRYEAAMVDLRMPDGNGLDLLRMAQQRRLRTRMIVYSGFVSTESSVEAGRLGVAEVLEKPLAPRLVMDALLRAVTAPAFAFDDVRTCLVETADARTSSDQRRLCLRLSLEVLANDEIDLAAFATITHYVRGLRACPADRVAPGLLAVIEEFRAPAVPLSPSVKSMLDVIVSSKISHVSEVSAHLHLSKARRQELTEESGRSLRQWIRLARVQRAVRLMMVSAEHIQQCAFAAGYPAARQLNCDVRIELGIRPKDIRAALQSELR